MTRESLSNTHHVLAGLGLLSALPAFHFVTGSILKYELGLLPGVSIYPVPPVILLGGTFIAVALNVYPALRLRLTQDTGTFTLSLTVHLWSWNMVILTLSGLVTAILIGYVIVENLMEATG